MDTAKSDTSTSTQIRTTSCILMSGLQSVWQFETSIISSALPPTEGTLKSLFVSDTFTVGTKSTKESVWKLALDPCYIENGTRYLGLYFQLVDLKTTGSAKQYVETLFRLSLRNPFDTNAALIEFQDMHGRKMDLENSSTFGWSKFMKYSGLGSDPHPVMAFEFEVTTTTDPEPLRDFHALRNSSRIGMPTLEIQKIANYLPVTSAASSEMPQNMEEATEDEMTKILSKVALKLLWNKRYTEGWENADCIVHSENKCLAAHVSVLAIKSLKFKAMIKAAGFSPCKEEPFNLVCQEWPDEVVESILEYCYTEDLTLLSFDTDETMWQLAQASVLYQIHGLDKLSREMFLLNTNVDSYDENYLRILLLNAIIIQNLEETGQFREDMDRLVNYDKWDFLQELLGMRQEYPSVLGDYKEYIEEYTALIFDRSPVYRFEDDQETSDGEIDMEDGWSDEDDTEDE